MINDHEVNNLYTRKENPKSLFSIKTYQVVGKPSKQFFHLPLSALEMEDAEASQVLMVGDDIKDDVLGKLGLRDTTRYTITGAQDAGLVGALVQTGKYMEGDENRGPGVPDFVFPGILQAIKAVIESLK